MIAYIVRRTLIAALTVLIISFFSFVIAQLPEGDLADQFNEYVGGVQTASG